MNSQTLVSIIIPVYNVAPYIEACIKSIQVQTYSNLEIIIINDGSTDGSGEICEEIAKSDDRIQVVKQENSGVVMARRKGVEFSSGKYILFVDGDDWIEPETVEFVLTNIGLAEMLSFGVYKEVLSNSSVERYDEFPEGLYLGELQIAEILKNMIYDFSQNLLQRLTPWGCNKLFLSDLVKEVYQEIDPEITLAEDTVFIYKCLLRCKSIVISHHCFYHYRYRKESAIHAVNREVLISINKVYLSLYAEFREHSMGDNLLLQLQKWVLLMNYWAINSYMGFDRRIYIPEFVVNLSDLENKKIILYGAGKVGKIAYEQLKKFGYEIVLWVDKNYKYYQDINMPVVAVERLMDKEYDLIYIAVSEQEVAERIKIELIEKGISGNKLIWKEPMKIFDYSECRKKEGVKLK